MSKTSESDLGLAVMQVLTSRPEGNATVRTLISQAPSFVNLTAEDHEPSETRPNEEMWEQRVRNLKSHDKSPGNVIAEGYVKHLGQGKYQLTDAGRLHLKHKGLA